jgi:regulator of PEP synthase PpsR (kinase-PPPase family)
MPPSEIPGLTHRADSHYFQRVEAAEFAVRYDDGKDPKAIGEADLVLVGVSRTSKTPLSLYLANRRMKVANVPVAPELPVPDLLTKQAQKVVGLTMEPGLLLSVRRERVRALGVTMPSSYASESRIAVELAFAQDLFERIGCPVVDVSHQAVEETADKVLTAWRNRTQRPAEGGWIGPLR